MASRPRVGPSEMGLALSRLVAGGLKIFAPCAVLPRCCPGAARVSGRVTRVSERVSDSLTLCNQRSDSRLTPESRPGPQESQSKAP